MNQNDQIRELKPCPFCGSQPEFPDGSGTCYDLACGDCGQAGVSIQISDLMTREDLAERITKTLMHAMIKKNSGGTT